jgi:hypothetical protein
VQKEVIGWQHASSPFAFESKVPGNGFTHGQLAKPQSDVFGRWRSGAVIELVVGDRREM